MKKQLSFKELVNKNKGEIINDQKLLQKIEEKIDNRHHKKMTKYISGTSS
ncbi:hypothetical protein GCM10011391_38080 [Pullulanibacillus camelliae]|uniref:FbpB family small basic protein n=1 Tax=Pullulanibacillus camelliae TaxID=1707096 RepID=A0A8J2YNI3_9BACL|nr:FbpB family small basic protein [Pullulanibacillus camelliae]GGE55456.1 hypothetical protein GCM10011391_38080 [Pullulanibacillus camelliae]